VTKYRHTRPPLETNPPKRTPPDTCPVSGKRMYPNERDAAAAAKHRMSDQQTGGARLRTYRCQYCGTFHLTSKEA
jgi:hypothetical protein